MDLGIAGRVALVTGGSRGLGRHAALALAREGARVAICARGSERLAETAKELEQFSERPVAVSADITNKADTHRLVETVVADLGPVEILVNNAGGSRGSTLERTSDADLREGFELNLFGGLELIRLVAPEMRARGWGRIINIASIYGREHGGSFAYMTAKSALISATKHLAMEMASDGVLVNSVAPGSILFEGGSWERFVQNSPAEQVESFIANNFPMGKFGWPEAIGDTVAFLASERASLITGACLNVDGGQSKSLI